jgi:hypothetical protein
MGGCQHEKRLHNYPFRVKMGVMIERFLKQRMQGILFIVLFIRLRRYT